MIDLLSKFLESNLFNSRLYDHLASRDNNYNLIRFLAALAVLISHSYPLFYGDPGTEPLKKITGKSLGSLAVDIFFLTSGFLIMASFIKRRSTINYFWSRAIRIFPALWVALLVTLLIIIPLSHPTTAQSILSSSEATGYLLKNSILIARIEHTIPGVFDSTPYKSAINGSLWTLPWELYCYLAIAIGISLLTSVAKKYWRLIYSSGALVVFLYCIRIDYLELNNSIVLNIVFMFYIGSLFYHHSRKVILSPAILYICVLSLITNFIYIKSVTIYFLTAPYILFYIVYIPKGKIRLFNRLGDYSYGVYIYAFPIQQLIIQCLPNISFNQYVLTCSAITIIMAWLSWNLIERNALKLKNYVQ